MKSILKTTILISIFIFVGYSCDDDPTEENQTTPGRRDYTWTWDTLDINYLFLTQIWGSSPNDVWAVGENDWGEGLWHYNGNKWSKYPQPWGMIPSAIYGFASNDVWIACAGPSFWHWNGTSWTKFSEHILPDYNVIRISDIWGDSPNNIYAVGYKYQEPNNYSVLMHYDRTKWEYVNIQDENVSFYNLRKNNSDGKYYIAAYSIRSFEPDSDYVYRFDGINLEQIKKTQSSEAYLGVYHVKGKVYIVEGKKNP